MSEATIDKLQIEVESEAKNASQGLEKLKKTLDKIKKVSENSGLSKIKQELKDISSINFDNVKPLATMLDNINSKSRKALSETKKLREELEKMQKTASVPTTNTPDISPPSVSGNISPAPLTDTENNSKKSFDISNSVSIAQRLKNILGSIHTKTANTDVDKLNEKLKTSNRYSMSLGQLFKHVVLFGGAFRLFSMATTGVSEGLKNIARYSNETSTNMDKLSTMSLQLKNSIGAALYPVIVALTPALQTVTNVLTGALNIFNMFISALQGKDTYIKASTYLDSYADKTETTAAKIKRSLAGFDEINIIGDNSSKSSSANTPDYSAMFETAEIPAGLQKFTEGISDIVSSLKLSFDDVFIDWKNLTGEQVAQKVITGLGLLVGGVTGFLIGGVPGAVKGALTGASLGLTFSSLIFNHDGEISGEEIATMIYTLVGGLTGGILGAKLGKSVKGAAIGFSIGAALGLSISKLTFDYDGNLSTDEIGNMISLALGGLAGAGIGFIIGGVPGAAIGIAIGTGISLSINSLVADWGELKQKWEGFLDTASKLVEDAKEDITRIAGNIWGGIKDTWTDCKQWLSDKKSEVTEKWQDFTSGIQDKTAELKGEFTQKKEEITEKWNNIVSGVEDKVKEVKANLSQKKKDITEKWDSITSGVTNKTKELKGTFTQKKKDLTEKWDSITSGVKNKTKELKGSFTQKKKDLTEKWDSITSGIKNKSASVSLSLANGKTAVTNLWGNVKTWWGEKTLSFKLAISDIQSGIKGFINTKLITPVNNVLQKIDKDWKIPLLYKDGGIVPYGQMFIAREAGPEMVGTIGNQTAVANNSQIVEGIASGVYEANGEQNMLLREQNSLLRQLLNKDSSFEITAASVAKSLNRKNKRDGTITVPVGV